MVSTFTPPNVTPKEPVDVDTMNESIASNLRDMLTAGRSDTIQGVHQQRRAARLHRPSFEFSKVSHWRGEGALHPAAGASSGRKRAAKRRSGGDGEAGARMEPWGASRVSLQSGQSGQNSE